MDRRMFDMLDLYNESNQNRSMNENQMPDKFFNSDYYVAPPRDFNDGILTMAFVNMQPLDSVYETEKSFDKGTLFPNLDKPFFGGRNK